MSLFGFLKREKRSAATIASNDPYLAEWFGQGGLGAHVDPERLMSNSAVAVRCIGLRSETLASVGLHVFRRTSDGGRERANDHPLYGVLHDAFNAQMSAFEGREFLIRQLDMYGNAYARVERDHRGEVTGLYPYPAKSVAVERLESGRMRYRVTERGGSSVLVQEEMLHIKGPSRDGGVGVSQIQYAREAMGLRVTQTDTYKSLMNNGLRSSGMLSFPSILSSAQRDSLRQSIKDVHLGVKNTGNILVLDGGVKYEATSWTPEDAEFLSSVRLANEDVARIFGVPPTSVGIADKATYSNTEQEARALVQNCLGPLAARIEAAMQLGLLTPEERAVCYVEHDLSALLRGDVQARFEAYRIAREIGAFSPNDVRRRENEAPIAGGDTYHQPANWVPLGTNAEGEGNG